MARVIVQISGGLCGAVYSDEDISVEVLDYDNMKAAECLPDRKEEYEGYKILEKEIVSGLEQGKLKAVW